MELNLDHVPCRETGMTAYEMMLSESQERMLCVLKPGSEEKARAIFDKWELDCATIGVLTDTGHLVIKHHGQIEADLPLAALEPPMYERDWVAPARRPEVKYADLAPTNNLGDAVKKLLACPDSASKRWIYEQYDSMVGADTIVGPGQADAAIVRIHGGNKGMAMTTDCTPRYCLAHPFVGGAQAVAESYRNLCATGAEPLAWTNNLNFGNPEKRDIMGQIVGCIGGMRNAGEALDYPVVSGNCSLYNETDGQAILPTPVVGGVGVIKDVSKAMTLAFKDDNDSIIVLGQTTGWIGCSLYLREVYGREDGAPPPIDLGVERKHGTFVRKLIEDKAINACHDVSDGGIALALVEMAIKSKANRGCEIVCPEDLPIGAFLFGEDQGRYIVTAKNPDDIIYAAAALGIPAQIIGKVTGDAVNIKDAFKLKILELRNLNEEWLPNYMAGKN
jgi:phosphoribosylformylglycinamidine synthase